MFQGICTAAFSSDVHLRPLVLSILVLGVKLPWLGNTLSMHIVFGLNLRLFLALVLAFMIPNHCANLSSVQMLGCKKQEVCAKEWLRCSLAALADPEKRFPRRFAKSLSLSQDPPKPTFRKQDLFKQQVGCVHVSRSVLDTNPFRSKRCVLWPDWMLAWPKQVST